MVLDKNSWYGWNTTADEVAKINKQDKNAIDNFFANNYERIQRKAHFYIRDNGIKIDVGDLVNSLYLDLFLWGRYAKTVVANGLDICTFVSKSFYYSQFGGMAYLFENNPKAFASADYLRIDTVSFDTPILPSGSKKQEKNNKTLLEVLVSTIVFDDNQEQENARNYEICKNACFGYLSKREQQYLDYYLQGYAPKVIADKLGVKQWGQLRKSCFAKLVIHYNDIVNYLLDNGIELPAYVYCPPADFDKCKHIFERTPEQKRKATEYMRQRRALQKVAIMQQLTIANTSSLNSPA